jgi:hypothetical protein
MPVPLIYDPRERKEDASVKEKTEGLSEVLAIMSPDSRTVSRV